MHQIGKQACGGAAGADAGGAQGGLDRGKQALEAVGIGEIEAGAGGQARQVLMQQDVGPEGFVLGQGGVVEAAEGQRRGCLVVAAAQLILNGQQHRLQLVFNDQLAEALDLFTAVGGSEQGVTRFVAAHLFAEAGDPVKDRTAQR